ncbi:MULTISPECIES: NAD(P)/FAD-dependent oxidoreductase [unclassified Variovorax]|jgi:L-2-hydroxyglutarate oxidase LhgO|uniref:NAD(P)/FAD-dependent oxidoreductase n=1 Tax=unclassified Variovorax TaxID=663243 RepID=UPI000F7E769F|nr:MULTISPECIES: NAD(P)/FAD-dependent oxidoreductase [unclassified Variovorax]RSZ39553.1 NAD(P)/FAD-dependent oxidoreductase [Variovorax sp. 553]RSZ40743.1 NAD(P)/FAD-dependent oxidoreductase [Variovorax sp. 679]
MDEIDCAVIGGGVVGLAVARALALTGREVLVLESEGAIGTGTSSRNSEVIHAGIYYPQGSLKARLCVEGKELLYAYAAERGVPHQRCGKLIVATLPEQAGQLEVIRTKAAANGVDDLELITAQQAGEMEPQLHCVAALHSPSTGIVDSHALMLSLLGDLENAGGMLALKSPILRAECGGEAIILMAEDGTTLRCRSVVNATGLGAPALARRFEGLPSSAVPKEYFAKGNYFTLSGRAPFGRLVYPVPEPGGLGVHLTIDLGGQAKFGPDVQWVSSPDELVVDPARGESFYTEVRKYWPALPDGALIPGYAGMRPKISGPGEPAADFMIDGPASHGVPGLVNLFGIESPGLTSSLAIARHVAALLADG